MWLKHGICTFVVITTHPGPSDPSKSSRYKVPVEISNIHVGHYSITIMMSCESIPRRHLYSCTTVINWSNYILYDIQILQLTCSSCLLVILAILAMLGQVRSLNAIVTSHQPRRMPAPSKASMSVWYYSPHEHTSAKSVSLEAFMQLHFFSLNVTHSTYHSASIPAYSIDLDVYWCGILLFVSMSDSGHISLNENCSFSPPLKKPSPNIKIQWRVGFSLSEPTIDLGSAIYKDQSHSWETLVKWALLHPMCVSVCMSSVHCSKGRSDSVLLYWCAPARF